MDKRKVIISVAPTSADSKHLDPDALCGEILRAREQGAAMAHLHVRDENGRLTDDLTLFTRVVKSVRASSDIVLQASTGGVSSMNIRQRCAPLYLEEVETASLNVGSVNLGEAVYQNPIADVEYCVQTILEQGKFPEVEVFELGMIETVRELDAKYGLPRPLLLDIVLGHRGEAPASVDALIAMRSMLPPGALWGITQARRRGDYSILAAALSMGASLVRIGFEDSDWLDGETRAADNAALVSQVADLIRAIGLEPATPDEARAMLQLF